MLETNIHLNVIRIKVLAILIILSMACGIGNYSISIGTPTPVYIPTAEDYRTLNGWLTDKSCELKCWMGITPGITTIDEADSLLKDAFQYTYYNKRSPSKSLAGGAISWRLSTLNGDIQSSNEENIVDFVRYHPNGSLTIQEINDAVGEPSHIEARSNFGNRKFDCQAYTIRLVYLEQGVALYWDVPIQEGRDSAKIEPDYTDFFMSFFGGKISNIPFGLSDLRPWEGYGEVTKYVDPHECDNLAP